ncbi:hypothetical protein [Skermanella stibiiresistens]|uniref:hypothetical protein n=1 Tax=Skermanella stibiiresistens TaxID=913326 RepID=UPI0012F959F6|nr:hypothetical protein [Skermanella stibiiresistens]
MVDQPTRKKHPVIKVILAIGGLLGSYLFGLFQSATNDPIIAWLASFSKSFQKNKISSVTNQIETLDLIHGSQTSYLSYLFKKLFSLSALAFIVVMLFVGIICFLYVIYTELKKKNQGVKYDKMVYFFALFSTGLFFICAMVLVYISMSSAFNTVTMIQAVENYDVARPALQNRLEELQEAVK